MIKLKTSPLASKKLKNITGKIRISHIIIILIFFVGLLLRVTTFQYPYERNDSRRDHLVARHIVQYQEFPKVGPLNAFTGEKHSPLYFYFLAALLLIQQDFFFISIENIVLQTSIVLIIYKIAKILFDEKTALLSAFLFAFNLFALRQSAFIWLTSSMQIFLNLSFVFLLLSYQNKHYFSLLLSIFLFMLAAALVLSPLALAPFFALTALILLRRLKAKINHYIGAAICAAIPFAAYFPVVNSHFQAQMPLPTQHFAQPKQFILNIFENIPYFVSSIFFDIEHPNIVIKLFAAAILFLLIFYLFSIKEKLEKFYALIVLSACLVILLFISAFDLNWFKWLAGSHYFTPVFGIFIILLSRALLVIFTKNKFYKTFGIFLLSIYLGSFLTFVYNKFYKGHNPFMIYSANVPPVSAIKNEILTIKKQEDFKDYYFFNVVAYADGFDGWKYTPTVWAILEEDLKTKFVVVDDKEVLGFKAVYKNKIDYIFLVCPTSAQRVQKIKECSGKSNGKSVFTDKGYAISLVKTVP